jgi:hypothetical protein
MSAAKPKPSTHWILGGFKEADKCLDAIRALRKDEAETGPVELDVYSNYPIHGAEEALGMKKSKVPLIVLCSALFGALNGYSIQTWANATGDENTPGPLGFIIRLLHGPWAGSIHGYLLNIGGRTAHAWPLNIPVTFELGVLLGAFGAVFGMLILNGLPRLHHPVFEVEAFRSAQIDRYWISVATQDESKREPLQQKLAALGAEDVSAVEEPAE